MADDLQRLVVSLEARVDKFNKAMDKANGTATRRARQIESTFARANKRISGQLAGMARGFVGALAAQASLRAAKELIDTATRVDNALKVAGLAGEELDRVYDRLLQSAQRNAAPLEALVELYGRAALVQKELGITGEELLGFTDKIAVALRVSGKSAAESSGALLQLSQALGSGVVRAEEFNSILEGALPIAQAAAAGLEEAGGSVAKLRQLVVDGKISSEAFFRAFEAGSNTLSEKVVDAELTVSQHLVRLQNVLVKTAGKFNETTGASDVAGDAIAGLASIIEAIGDVAQGVADGPLGRLVSVLTEVVNLASKFEPISKALGMLTADNIRGVGELLSGDGAPDTDAALRRLGELEHAAKNAIDATHRAAIEAEIAAVEAAMAATGNFGVGPSTRGGGRGVAADQKQVTLKDFKLPTSTKSGGGSRSKRDSFERETEQILERTLAILAETAAQKGVCGTIFILEDCQ